MHLYVSFVFKIVKKIFDGGVTIIWVQHYVVQQLLGVCNYVPHLEARTYTTIAPYSQSQ
jgi:hypothetical protein